MLGAIFDQQKKSSGSNSNKGLIFTTRVSQIKVIPKKCFWVAVRIVRLQKFDSSCTVQDVQRHQHFLRWNEWKPMHQKALRVTNNNVFIHVCGYLKKMYADLVDRNFWFVRSFFWKNCSNVLPTFFLYFQILSSQICFKKRSTSFILCEVSSIFLRYLRQLDSRLAVIVFSWDCFSLEWVSSWSQPYSYCIGKDRAPYGESLMFLKVFLYQNPWIL